MSRIWGSARNTDDFDICAATTRANRERLAPALTELDARFPPPGLEEGFAPPGGWDERSFGSLISLAVTTPFGWFDVWFVPDGTGGYDDLIKNAARAKVGEHTVKVAALADIIRSKSAAARDRDLQALSELEALRRRRDELGLREP